VQIALKTYRAKYRRIKNTCSVYLVGFLVEHIIHELRLSFRIYRDFILNYFCIPLPITLPVCLIILFF
jgi:hypothetical protein